MKTAFKPNEIIVITETQYMDCGAVRVYKDEIVKVKSGKINHYQMIQIYRGKKREDKDDWSYTLVKYTRPATIDEQFKYEQGKHNIND